MLNATNAPKPTPQDTLDPDHGGYTLHHNAVDLEAAGDATSPIDVRGLSSARCQTFLIDDDTYTWTGGGTPTTVTIQGSMDGNHWNDTNTQIIAEGMTGVIDCRGYSYLRGAVTTDQSGTAGIAAVLISADASDPTATPDAAYGSAFPSDPAHGQAFYRTDLEESFHYSATIGKWLGEARLLTGGNSSTANPMYARYGNQIGGTTTGAVAMWDGVCTEASFSNTASITGDLEMRINGTGTVAVSVAAALKGKATGLNIPFSADDILSGYITASAGTPAAFICSFTLRRAIAP
jgi:hypothetical protein